jgi:hypothetical protein
MPLRGLVHRRERTRDQLFQMSMYLSIALGITCLVVASQLSARSVPHGLVFGIGTSLLASALFLLLTGSRDNFANHLRHMGVEFMFENRDAAFQTQDWTNLILSARHHYRVLGVANHGYMREGNAAETRAALQTAAVRGVKIEILWLDPTDARAVQREVEEEQRGTRRDAIASLKWFWALKESLPLEARKNLTLRIYAAIPTCGITWVDKYLIVAYYLPSSVNRFSPGMVLRKDNLLLRGLLTMSVRGLGEPQIAARYIGTYEALSSASTTIDSANQILELEKRVPPPPPPNRLSEEDLSPPTAT